MQNDRYLVVNEPDGSLSVALNEQVKTIPVHISIPPPQTAQQVDALVIMSPPLLQSNAVESTIHYNNKYTLISQYFAFILLMAAIVTVILPPHSPLDVVNVVLMSFTFVAVSSDNISALVYLLIHAVFTLFVIAFHIAYKFAWVQVGFQLSCLALCTFVLSWRNSSQRAVAAVNPI